MFRKVSGIAREGVAQEHVDKRFEYFHNYWQVAQPKDTEIFFDEVRLESHRSMLTKIEHQIKYNFAMSNKWFNSLFRNHEFFSPNNLIAKPRDIQKLCLDLKNAYQIGATHNHKKNQRKILTRFKKVKNAILHNEEYSVKLAKHLVHILEENSPLDESTKKDIRFLVGAFIVELYHFGYKLDYIAAIPDILTLNHWQHKFPVEKTSEDFDFNEKEFEKYRDEETKNLTVEKCLSGLVNLVSRKPTNGFFVFKVDNIYLFNPHPITIGDVTFYNPQIERRLKIFSIDEKLRKNLTEVENFYAPKEGEEVSNANLSNCNAIVPSKFIPIKNIVSPETLFKAYHIANRSLEILNDIMNRHGRTGPARGKISFHRHFLLHDNGRLANTSLDIFSEKLKRIDYSPNDTVDKEKFEEFESDLLDLQKIDVSTPFGAKLMHIISVRSKLENNHELFNFKDLWMAWESLMDEATLKKVAKVVFRFHYRKDYLTMTKIFLNIHLWRPYKKENPKYWSLSDSDMLLLGLNIEHDVPIETTVFQESFKKIGKMVKVEMVNDLIARVDNFVNHRKKFFVKLDQWVENTLDEVYMERNFEVHKNITNDLSKFKLKENFLSITRWVTYMLATFTDWTNPDDINKTLKTIRSETLKIKF